MRRPKTWTLACVAITAGAAAAASSAMAVSCDSNVPVKRRAVIMWDGVNESRFMSSLKFMNEFAAKNAQASFLAVDARALGEAKSLQKSNSSLKLFKALSGVDGLAGLAQAVNEDEGKYLAQNVGASQQSYELVMFVTNHGHQLVGDPAKGPTEYFIAKDESLSPSVDSFAGQGINRNELASFAKALPAGIRVKLVFGQCYGSDTQDQVLNALSDQSCACGVAQAPPGTTAFTQPSAADAFPMWEGLVARAVRDERLPLLQSAWEGDNQDESANLGSGLLDDGRGGYGSGNNWSGSSSERLVLQKLSSSPEITRQLGHDDQVAFNPESLESIAWDLAKNKSTGAEAKVVSESDRLRDRYVLRLLKMNVSDDASSDHDQVLKWFSGLQSSLDAARAQSTVSPELYLDFKARISSIDEAVKNLSRSMKAGSVPENFKNSAAEFKYEYLVGQREHPVQSNEGLASAAVVERLRTWAKTESTLLDAAAKSAGPSSAYATQLGEARQALREFSASAELDRVSAIESTNRDFRAKHGKNELLAYRIAARALLEKSFLASATAADRARFEKLRRCELESLGPLTPPANPAPVDDGNHSPR